jgi:hypothetical protein
MLVMRTTKYPANSVGELVSREQCVGFYYLALAVYPLGLYGIVSHDLCLGRAGSSRSSLRARSS